VVKAGQVSDAEAIQHLAGSPHWVWGAIDPVTKLLLTIDVGGRTLAMAQHVVHQVVQALAPDCGPLFITDGFKEYATAPLTYLGHWVQPSRRQAKGPLPKPRWMPQRALRYAQVVKTYPGPMLGPCEPPDRLRDPGWGYARAGPHGLAHQHGVHRGATRWSKGSFGFRAAREVKITLATRFP
jgi:hypothetical protein